MPELNKANRQVCDVDIRDFKTKAPILFFDTANVTTVGLTSDNTYAMAKGSKKIAFSNPLDGSLSIEAQVYPFKLFSLLSDGSIESNAAYAEHKTITCETEGEIALAVQNGNIEAGTVFVYPEGEFGNEDSAIKGTFVDGKFTATTIGNIAVGENYEAGYIVSRTSGVKKITFNNKKLPKDYFITMKTIDRSTDDLLTPFVMTAYRASIVRSLDLSFSSEGDAMSVKLDFSLLEDNENNVFDMVELTGDAE